MLVLEDEFPDFPLTTTEGNMNLHDYIGDSWCVMFCHSLAFTPICTTDLARVVQLMKEFHKRNVKCIGMTCSSNSENEEWTKDIMSYASQHNLLGISGIHGEGLGTVGTMGGWTGTSDKGPSGISLCPGCSSGLRDVTATSGMGTYGMKSGMKGDVTTLGGMTGMSSIGGMGGMSSTGGMGGMSGMSGMGFQGGMRGDLTGMRGDVKEWKNVNFPFPIISDMNHSISTKLGLIRPTERTKTELPKTVRNCFIITPDKRLKCMMWYPDETGRNYREILRIIDSVQLSERNNNKTGTPAEWTQGESCLVIPVTRATEIETEQIRGAEVVKVPSGRQYLKFVDCSTTSSPTSRIS